MVKNFLIMLNSLLQIQLKLYQKERFWLLLAAEAARNFIGKKITDKITRVSKASPKINSETNKGAIL